MISPLSKYYFPILIGFILASCSSTVYLSLYQTPPLKADGSAEDWSLPLKNFDSGNNMYYSLSNDLDNLYIRVKTRDNLTQMRILSSGIQFWLDTSGKNKEQIGLQFPITLKPHKRTATVNRENRDSSIIRKPADLASLKNKFLNDDKRMHVEGFKPPVGGILPVPNDFGIAMNIDWDSTGAMIYEASIPFRTFYKTSLSPNDSAKLMGVKIDINGMPYASNGMGARPGAYSGMGMGMGGMGMGGYGGMGFGLRIPLGGGMGPGSYPGNYSSSSEIKFKIKLSVKP